MIERATIQCPECGGEIVVCEDGSLGRCSSCENEFRYAVPNFKERFALINQANFLRRRGDFEGASMLYNDLVKLDPDDPNNYWGLVLTAYGIEYVADPKSGKCEMTCRRTETKSVFSSKHYQMALAKAPLDKQARYRQEAARIDALQSRIKERLKDEESYDVFICFKSTDEGDVATEDRTVARRIFDELSRRGIKTFFSEISLKNKLGAEYEPIIYKALYTAQVMILVATKEEYISSIWVRNEWTRFRDRIHEENLKDASFAVFKDIPRTSLPPLFRSQGVDLNKYPFGGYEIEIADALSKRFKKTQDWAYKQQGYTQNSAAQNQNAQQGFVQGSAAQNQTQQAYAGQNIAGQNVAGQSQSQQQGFTQNSAARNQNAQQGFAQNQNAQQGFAQNSAGQNQNSQQAYAQGFGDERARPRNFNDKAYHSKGNEARVEANLSREEVNKELSKLVREKQHFVRLKEHAEEAYNVSRAAMKRAADQRKGFATEKEKVDRIMSTPDYFKKSARRKASSVLWLRLLLTVLLFALVIPFVHETWIMVMALTSGVLIIWYRQFMPVSKRTIDKKKLIFKEREQLLREQIIQCEMQLATLNRKFDKSRTEITEADKKIAHCNAKLAEYCRLYPFAEKQLEKLNASIAHKVANAVSDGIIGIAGGIDKGINAMKDTLFK